jgi:hypothetical protein
MARGGAGEHSRALPVGLDPRVPSRWGRICRSEDVRKPKFLDRLAGQGGLPDLSRTGQDLQVPTPLSESP